MIKNEVFLTTINLISNPIIVTNGAELIVSNDNFIEFLNYKSLEEFVKCNSCVCNLFIKDKNYFSNELISDDTLWTDYIYEHNNCNDNILVSILDKNNIPRVFEMNINNLDNYPNHYIVVFTDITAVQREKELLEKLAYIDPLTNIFNRQMFNKELIKEKENMTRYGDILSLIMFDIDHFKKVNDTYGHDVGDNVLTTLTQIVTKHLRKNDIFARWGGEEFMILLPRTGIDIAYKKAEELRKIIENYQDSLIPKITVSFGVTQILDRDKEQLCFKRVDNALYKAKEKRNCVVKV